MIYNSKKLKLLDTISYDLQAEWLYNHLCNAIKKSELSNIYKKKDVVLVLKHYGLNKKTRGILASEGYEFQDFAEFVIKYKHGISSKSLALKYLYNIKSARVINEKENFEIKDKKSISIEDNENMDEDKWTVVLFVCFTLIFSIYARILSLISWLACVLIGMVISLVLTYLIHKGYKSNEQKRKK